MFFINLFKNNNILSKTYARSNIVKDYKGHNSKTSFFCVDV